MHSRHWRRRQLCPGRRARAAQVLQPDRCEIARESLLIAAGIDIYTNTNIVVEELVCKD